MIVHAILDSLEKTVLKHAQEALNRHVIRVASALFDQEASALSMLLVHVPDKGLQDLVFSEMLASLFVRELICLAKRLLSVKGVSTHVLCTVFVTSQLQGRPKRTRICTLNKLSSSVTLPIPTLPIPPMRHRAREQLDKSAIFCT